jgi:hypothetical protein
MRVPIIWSSFGIAPGFCTRTERISSATLTWPRASSVRCPSRGFTARAVLDPEATCAVILMGPSAGHVDPASLDVGPDPFAVTFDVLFVQRTETSS